MLKTSATNVFLGFIFSKLFSVLSYVDNFTSESFFLAILNHHIYWFFFSKKSIHLLLYLFSNNLAWKLYLSTNSYDEIILPFKREFSFSASYLLNLSNGFIQWYSFVWFNFDSSRKHEFFGVARDNRLFYFIFHVHAILEKFDLIDDDSLNHFLLK